MILRQTFDKAISNPWEFDGVHQTFDWSIDCSYSDGYSKVGSWSANRWYEVKTGKTDKQTLSNAKRNLSAMMARKGYNCTFKYIEE